MLIDWGKTYLVSSTFSKLFCSEYFFFNVHARIACNAKAFRNVVLNQSFKVFFLHNPLKHYFTLVFSFWNRTSHLLHARWRNVWVACELPILKRFFFYELITINNQIEFIRMGLKHVFYFYPLYHWAHKKIRVSVYISSASVHAKCDRKLLPLILQTSSAVFLCVEVNKNLFMFYLKFWHDPCCYFFCNLPFRMCTC